MKKELMPGDRVAVYCFAGRRIGTVSEVNGEFIFHTDDQSPGGRYRAHRKQVRLLVPRKRLERWFVVGTSGVWHQQINEEEAHAIAKRWDKEGMPHAPYRVILAREVPRKAARS